MTRTQLAKALAASAAVVVLTACGGGGGGVASTPPPPVAPTPTPTPGLTTQSAVKVFPGVTTTTNFSAIGIDINRGTSPTVASAAVSVRYDASSGTYLMAFPGEPEAPYYEFAGNSVSDTWWRGDTLQSNGNAPAVVNVLKPTNPEQQFTYTTLAHFDTGGMGGGSIGWMAFGTPTAAGSVPIAGTATYKALVRGSVTDTEFRSIEGSATLLFDFARGGLSGHLDPWFVDDTGGGRPLGSYSFFNTVYSSGSTTFTGQLSQAGLSGTGSFNGQFTGPSAQELMATWSAPYLNPDTKVTSTMFGVWVGSK